MFSISKFRQNVQVVRPNLFFAEVYLPEYLASKIRQKDSKLAGSAVINNGAPANWYNSLEGADLNSTFRFRCEASEMPGRTVATSDEQSYGPSIKHAYETTYSDINLQIIASADMRERAFFEIWVENIVNNTNFDASGGYSGKGGLSKYYDEYAKGQVRLYQLDDRRTQLARYTLYNAFPIQISPMNLTWEETNTYQRFAVTMTYRFHIVDFNQGTININ
jgi:hypothetical protein